MVRRISPLLRKIIAASTVWLILSAIGSVTTTIWLILLQREDARMQQIIDQQADEIDTLRGKVEELSDNAEEMHHRISYAETAVWE